MKYLLSLFAWFAMSLSVFPQDERGTTPSGLEYIYTANADSVSGVLLLIHRDTGFTPVEGLQSVTVKADGVEISTFAKLQTYDLYLRGKTARAVFYALKEENAIVIVNDTEL